MNLILLSCPEFLSYSNVEAKYIYWINIINYLISILISFQGNNANNIHNVIDALIENHHVNDVTEECTKNAHSIQNVISIDQLNNKTDEENQTLLR